MIVQEKGYARAALLGNPSDGFYGKTIAFLARNFAATVELWESPELCLLPCPTHDPTEFASLENLREVAAAQGYYGGLRLILATCKKFADLCREAGLSLPPRNFTMRYRTEVPRQVGLGGSTSIIAAAFHALMRFYEVPEESFLLPERPNMILHVETEELDIQAGLQDRVVAVYGGLVYMDFAADLLEARGYGEYARLDPDLLPPLFIAWGDPGGESGKAHSPIRTLWERGDQKARHAMVQFAAFAEEGRQVLLEGDFARLGELMNANFDLRLELYGEDVIGEQTIRLVQIAREHGCCAKLPGSGGAVIGLVPATDEAWKKLVAAYEAAGYHVERAVVDQGGTMNAER